MSRKKKIAAIFQFFVDKKHLPIGMLSSRENYKRVFSYGVDTEFYSELEKKFNDHEPSVYDLIEQSIFVFDNKTKKENGIAYTSKKVAKKMVQVSLSKAENKENFFLFDPAVGSGIFLVAGIEELKKRDKKTISNIIENNIFGIDLIEDNVLFVRLLLDIMCLEQGENFPTKTNIAQFDSLELSNDKLEQLFGISAVDSIICNPPYVRAKHLSDEIKSKIKMFTTSFGVSDLYIPFFEIGIKLLKKGGVGNYITPNTFLRSLNGKKLRKYLREHSSNISIVNFDSEALFDGIQNYFSITIFTKKTNPSEDVKFEHLDSNFLDNNEKWTEFIPEDEWRTLSIVDKEIIYNLENNFEIKIGDLAIQNGVATQRNNIYSFNAIREDDKFYYFTYKDVEEKVENGITRPFVLPNTQTEYTNLRIIFPYVFDKTERKSTSITEEEFSSKFPFAYAYLKKHKEELNSRKHDKNIPNWFSYGRSQGISQYGKRLYLPYMADKVKTRISNSEDEVFAAGYAIFDDSTEYLLRLAKILESDIFSYYIKMVSKPYSNNYYSTAKNMIKYFSLPSKDELLSIPLTFMTDNYIEELYGITKTQHEWIDRILNM